MNKEELLEKSKRKYAEDELVGHLSFNDIEHKWFFSYRDSYSNEFIFPHEKENDVVCVVLESPHIKEFEEVCLSSSENRQVLSRPLNNPTSRNGLSKMMNSASFNREFSSKLDKTKVFDVVLTNAVQYQCSLGDKDTSKYRDDAFIFNWIESQNSFVERIQSIAPCLIINCCTKGTWRDDKYIGETRLSELGLELSEHSPVFRIRLSANRKDFTLKDLVECKLFSEGLINDSNYFRYDHPSSLFSNEARDIRASDKDIVSASELKSVSWKKKQQEASNIHLYLNTAKPESMKKRFFYAEETEHPDYGIPICAKLFVLTEDGYFYSEVNEDEYIDVEDEAHNFDTFDSTTYKWDGYQSIIEIDEIEAKNTALKDQKNWIAKYLSWRDCFRYITVDQMTSHYLGVNYMDVVSVYESGVYIRVDEKSGKKDQEISKVAVHACLEEHIDDYEITHKICKKYGPVNERPATRTIFGRVILQPEGFKVEKVFFISKTTLENVMYYLEQKESDREKQE